jgi:hypothetical protein
LNKFYYLNKRKKQGEIKDPIEVSLVCGMLLIVYSKCLEGCCGKEEKE